MKHSSLPILALLLAAACSRSKNAGSAEGDHSASGSGGSTRGGAGGDSLRGGSSNAGSSGARAGAAGGGGETARGGNGAGTAGATATGGTGAGRGGTGAGGESGSAGEGGASSGAGGEAGEGTGGAAGAGGSAERPVDCSRSQGTSPVSAVRGPSCANLPSSCGPNRDIDCCTSILTPCGRYLRSYDGAGLTDQTHPASVSDFFLDKYEVTVGRFRKFFAVYEPNMIAAGAGKNVNNPRDPGWDTAWNAELPADADALQAELIQGSNWITQGATTITDSRAVTNLRWFVAQAFCIWDGGRLPTEAEWNYAAAGGSEQRIYPWGNTNPNSTYASYYDGGFFGINDVVGSWSPKGDGRWGHADLAGLSGEWVQDWFVDPYPDPCTDCAVTTAPVGPFGPNRAVRGGDHASSQARIRAGYRDENSPLSHGQFFGARCARDR